MAPQASAVDVDNLFIPIIDFALFLNGTPEQRAETARSILSGFQSAGFIYLTNHPIPLDTVSHTFATSAEFFKRPQPEKEALGWTTPEANRGYVSHGREKVSTLLTKEAVSAAKAAAIDLKESIEIGREDAAGLPNNWPSGDPGAVHFKSTMLKFHDLAKELHINVMRAIAVGMGLPESYFDSYTDVGDNTLRLLHYPEVKKSMFTSNKLQVRAGEHTDYGSITLLFQDMRGGLQVKSPKGTFVDATPVPGSVVVNAGDLLARWSNDTIKSTLHRVVEPPAPEEGDVHPARYSIAYFCNPNFDRQIEAIEGTYGGEKGPKKYEGINSGEYLVQRLAATY
ncbi:related to gibberellin 20-oxidase [Rhynchosporium secalis]|uniref:Related to gibberellin 20-oxidase n=1 Tax=Rhynchosporium secalis TaxID=38038 RepID=A0A1E1LW44_RHYSE|nr:related to gibberellin 20-oxidase [Rhynchosporium secalis]